MTNEEAIKYFKRHLDLYCVDGISREAEEMAIQALSQISDIKAIINNPMHLQEDVLRYQMICEVVKE